MANTFTEVTAATTVDSAGFTNKLFTFASFSGTGTLATHFENIYFIHAWSPTGVDMEAFSTDGAYGAADITLTQAGTGFLWAKGTSVKSTGGST